MPELRPGLAAPQPCGVLAVAECPPHLKAIFVSGGHYDFYETTYHGGIIWFMPRFPGGTRR